MPGLPWKLNHKKTASHGGCASRAKDRPGGMTQSVTFGNRIHYTVWRSLPKHAEIRGESLANTGQTPGGSGFQFGAFVKIGQHICLEYNIFQPAKRILKNGTTFAPIPVVTFVQ